MKVATKAMLVRSEQIRKTKLRSPMKRRKKTMRREKSARVMQKEIRSGISPKLAAKAGDAAPSAELVPLAE